MLCDNLALGSSSNDPHIDRASRRDLVRPSHSAVNRDHALLQALQQVAGGPGRPARVWSRTEWLPVAAWEVLPPPDVRNRRGPQDASLGTQIRQLRRQKEPDELTLLRQCMRATDAGHARAWDVVRTGISEMDVFREVQLGRLWRWPPGPA